MRWVLQEAVLHACCRSTDEGDRQGTLLVQLPIPIKPYMKRVFDKGCCSSLSHFNDKINKKERLLKGYHP